MNKAKPAVSQLQKTRNLTETALFSVIVIVLAFTPFLGYIPLGFTRATTVHIPVILASILLGPKRGAVIGGVFGLTSLINNTFFPTLTSFVFSPFYSVGDAHGNLLSLVICFVPRILVGVVPYYVYTFLGKILKEKEIPRLVLAGIAGSLTNTLLVMNMIYFFFGHSYAAAKETAFQSLYGAILSVICINGIPEALVAAFITAAVGKILLVQKKKHCK